MTVLGPIEAVAAGLAAGTASLPHCALMCGPLSALACARSGHPRAQLGYQAGRLIGYGFAGSLAGHAGLALEDAMPAANGFPLLSLLTGLALVVLALRVLGALRPRSLTIGLPRHGRAPRSTRWRRLGAQLLPRSAGLLGAASTLLPCGALASALLLAASTADAPTAALVMASFAVATSPALWASTRLGQLTAYVRGRSARVVIAAALLAVATLVVVPRALRSEGLRGDPSAHGHPATACH